MTSFFDGLTGSMFTTDEMEAVFSGHTSIQRMLDFEASLARAEAHHGLIPPAAVAPIVDCCDAARIDLPALSRRAAAAGNLAVPLVGQLTAEVAQFDPDAAKYVHWGATSQDVIDTGLVLQLRSALDLLTSDLEQLAEALARVARQHQHTPMVGRTLMQHALPMTFGLEVAGWLDAVGRHQDRLAELPPRLLVLQFGGAAGTLASMGSHGPQVAERLAAELELSLPDVPWHAHRDRVAELATTLGLLVGSLGKMARDISLHIQTDVAELAEPYVEGRGASSTMPHKRNTVGSAVALAAAVRVPGLVSTMLSGMVQEHERALGGWQAEWDTLPEIVQLTAGTLAEMRQVATGLTVDAARMQENLDRTEGQIMAEAVSLALGAKIGRMAAHEVVARACRDAERSGRHLREVLGEDPEVRADLGAGELDRLFDPAGYTGQAVAYVDHVLKKQRQGRHRDRHRE